MADIEVEYFPNTSQKCDSPCLVVMTGRMLWTWQECNWWLVMAKSSHQWIKWWMNW